MQKVDVIQCIVVAMETVTSDPAERRATCSPAVPLLSLSAIIRIPQTRCGILWYSVVFYSI